MNTANGLQTCWLTQ